MNTAESKLSDTKSYVVKLGVQAREAARDIAKASTAQKNRALLAIAGEIEAKTNKGNRSFESKGERRGRETAEYIKKGNL